MRNINTLSPKYYFFLSVVGMLWGMLIYRPTVFRCLLFRTFNESKAILWAICGVCFVLTYLLTFRKRRNYASVLTNTLLPFGIYSLLAYDDAHLLIISVLEFAIMAVCFLYCFAVIVRKIRREDFDEVIKVIKSRLYHCAVGMKTIAALGLSVLIAYVYVLNVFGIPSVVPAVEPTKAVAENKQEILSENLPVISLIDESEWKKLSEEKKLDVLQTLANVEKAQQGISHEVLVCAEPLGFSTYGLYDHNSHTVTLNSNIIIGDDAKQAVKTLCHEVRHAYQHDVADAYLSLDKEYQQLGIFDDVRKYYENLDDYKQVSKDGFEEYENQPVEADSRAYSEKRSEFYFEQAKKYLDNKTMKK